jgi:pimeloyl-ACP methyl ester carboxylesterase
MASDVPAADRRPRNDVCMSPPAHHPFALLFLMLSLGACSDTLEDAALTSPPARAEVQSPAAASDDEVVLEQIAINGLVFDVRTAGPSDGEVVFLLHGFPQTSYQWRAQIPVLARAGYRVIAPDLRGVSPGARPAATFEYNIVNLLDDLLKMATHYGAPRFHVVGHDVGGTVAWGAAMLFPEKIKTLTALSVPHPAAYAKQLSDPNSCQRKASWWYQEILRPDAARNEFLWSLLRDTWATMDPSAVAEYQRVLGTPEAIEAALKVFRANFDQDLKIQAALPLPIQVPTVYVWGDRDPNNCGDGEPMTRALCPVSYRYEELAGVGHWISEQAADQLNAILLEHLGAHRE